MNAHTTMFMLVAPVCGTIFFISDNHSFPNGKSEGEEGFFLCVSNFGVQVFVGMATLSPCTMLRHSTPRCRMAAVSPRTVLMPPIDLLVSVLDCYSRMSSLPVLGVQRRCGEHDVWNAM